MVVIAFPLALAAGALLRLGLPARFLLRVRALRALHEADLVVDLSGISFVDGRGPILIYNVLNVLIPVLLRAPLLKYAQAMGPFRRRWNRAFAAWLLPKVTRIAARGRITAEHLADLGLPAERFEVCADAAFAVEIGPAAHETVRPLLRQPPFDRPVVAVSASSVVEGLCRRQGIPYSEHVADFIRYLTDERGYGVCLLAHSARPGRQSTKNNDLLVCQQIARAVQRPACVFPEQTYNAEALRAIIGNCRYLVASRFHAMVSGLAMQVPTMLVGWSHKYAEVLEMFRQEAFALNYSQVSVPALRDLFERLEHNDVEIRTCLAEHLPAVLESSLNNARLAAGLLTCARAARRAPGTLAAEHG
jgi:colanic acid/amylovoran biosynthesis protein